MLLLFWKIDGKLKDTLLKMYQIMHCFQATKVYMSKYIQKNYLIPHLMLFTSMIIGTTIILSQTLPPPLKRIRYSFRLYTKVCFFVVIKLALSTNI